MSKPKILELIETVKRSFIVAYLGANQEISRGDNFGIKLET